LTGFAALTVAATFALGAITIVAFRRLPTVQLQLVAVAVFASAVPITAVSVAGLVMFRMHENATILVVLVGTTTSTLVVALLLGSRISKRIAAMERAAAQIAGGDLGARAPENGPRELESLSVSFNQMAKSIGDLFDARRQLVAWASHDLRTPLASIQAMLEALEDGLAQPSDYLPLLREQAAVLRQLTDDLFELACIDAGTLTVELRETSLAELVTRCVAGLRAEADARNVSLKVELAESLPSVSCAPEHLQRVLRNLLTNALRHTPSDGAVAVRAVSVGDEVQVVVEDSGIGLTGEATQRMFERFWRADASRTRASGNAGLGLAIARGLVEAHGGRVWAENRREGGARVAFALPLRVAA
jgi:signal transduction histidine kinase